MAVYFLRARHVSRSKGARVTRAAAYRAGELILDIRTSELYDYTHRSDVACKEILLPADLAADPDMADLTIHRPRPGADARNHHAHLLMTTREVARQGLGDRISIEMGGRERHLRGLGDSRQEYLGLRERWAVLTNEALRAAGLEQRVDHRSFAAQGIDRDPTTTNPEKVFYAERRAGPSAAGDAIRARAQQRREARRRELRHREYLAFRQKHPDNARESTRRTTQRISPAQSFANWKAWREQHGPGPTAEESFRRWLEMRASGRAPEPSVAPPLAQAAAQPVSPRTAQRVAQPTGQPDPDHDLDFEL